MAWTIEHVESAATQSAAAWGLAELSISLASQGADTLTFKELGAAYDATPIFAFDDTLILRRDSTIVFVGRVQRVSARAARSEERSYTVAGPWSWLEQIVYQQIWHTTSGVDATVIEERRGRIVIGQDEDGNKRATGPEISAALQWAIDNGAAIAIGTIDASVTIPYQELVDVTVAELVRACLRWTPDAQTWFDYTAATPTLHIRRRASLAPAAIAISPTLAKSLEIRSREDMQVPACVLKYERSHSLDGEVWATTELDKYPALATGAEPRALVATIDLEGSSATYEFQELETAAIITDSKAFWKSQLDWLAAYADGDITITEDTLTDTAGGATTLDRYVISGAVADWMGVGNGEVIAKAKIAYTGSAGAAFAATIGTVRLVGTDTSKTTFSRLMSLDTAEATPVGLAEALYNALSVLHYEGSFTASEEEVSGLIHPGNTLRLTGGLAAWATMDAMVQQVTMDIDSGSTSIAFGPPAQLGPQDLVAQLRVTRNARSSWRRKERSTGSRAASGGYVEGPKRTAKTNASIAPSGGGSGPAFYKIDLGNMGDFVNISTVRSAVEGFFTTLGAAPAVGSFIVGYGGTGHSYLGGRLTYVVGPTSATAGGSISGGSQDQAAFSCTVLGGSFTIVQIGPNLFW